ncbi:MAG: hypothetical protein RCG15_07560 [Candidatus Rickettsia vulgarisii]
MLKIRYFNDFHNGYPVILISGESEDYLKAAHYLCNKEHARLNDSNFAIYYKRNLISQEKLYINKQECQELAEMFERFGNNYGEGHDYYDTEIEIKISRGGYSDAIFEDEED